MPNLMSNMATFLSAPSRGGRPTPPTQATGKDEVSIRALARRATAGKAPFDIGHLVSIRALARRATRLVGVALVLPAGFLSAPSRGGRRDDHVVCRNEGLFLSAPSRGGRLPVVGVYVPDDVFLSAPSRGGRRHDATGCRSQDCFYPRPRAEGDSHPSAASAGSRWFLSAPSRGGRLRAVESWVALRLFLSAPSRGGRRVLPLLACHPSRVSIRALARRATPTPRQYLCELRMFLSAPSRGGRPDGAAGDGHPPGFYPRPRAEGDPLAHRAAEAIREVSIRALARRATTEFASGDYVDMFLSAPSRGGRRRRPSGRASSAWCFYPRPRAEGDVYARRRVLRCRVSIRALARRATQIAAMPIAPARFLSAPSRGGRLVHGVIISLLAEFLSAPSRGGRR